MPSSVQQRRTFRRRERQAYYRRLHVRFERVTFDFRGPKNIGVVSWPPNRREGPVIVTTAIPVSLAIYPTNGMSRSSATVATHGSL